MTWSGNLRRSGNLLFLIIAIVQISTNLWSADAEFLEPKTTPSTVAAPDTGATPNSAAAQNIVAALNARGFETPAVLKASTILPVEIFKSENYAIDEDVETVDFYWHFHVDAPLGSYDVDTLDLLKTRARELDILSEARDVDGKYIFAKAVGNQIASTAKAAGKTIVTPLKTAKAVGSQVEQKTMEVLDFVRRKDRNLPKESFFFGEETRKLASKLNLDVYTTNPAVHELLDSIARPQTAGTALVNVSISVTTTIVPVALPVSLAITAVQYREKVTDTLEMLSPSELYRYNDKILKKLDISSKHRERFLESPEMTPRQKTEIVADLKTLGSVTDKKPYLETAAVQHAGHGVWQTQCADMLAKYNMNAETILELFPAGIAMICRTEKGCAIVFPADLIYWTEDVEKVVNNSAIPQPVVGAVQTRDFICSGVLTPTVRHEIERRGFVVHENFLNVNVLAPENNNK